jgi:thiamine-monophosphate kinase
MTELEIIERLRRRLPPNDPRLALGIGDDCAIYRPSDDEELLFTTDLFLENVHFRRSTSPRLAGAKALARGLSDIAAMAGDPRFCLVSLAAPNEQFIDEFYGGLIETAAKFHCDVAGGDLGRSQIAVCDIVVCGSAPRGQALTRSAAAPGHRIYVSGPLGRAASRNFDEVPEPRIDFGRSLRGLAAACMDLSDGLALDLHRMCIASGVAAALDEVPLFPGATLEQALSGGEDYELLFTAERSNNAPGLCIGEIIRGEPGVVTYRGERVPPRGYDHFA